MEYRVLLKNCQGDWITYCWAANLKSAACEIIALSVKGMKPSELRIVKTSEP